MRVASPARHTLGCCFCSELRMGRSIELTSRYGSTLLSRIVWRSREMAVLPTIGQLTEGHSLFVTLAHVNSFAALSPSARDTVQERIAELLALYGDEFGPCVAFEHGTHVGARNGACGIVHAHLHVVPVSADVRLRLPNIPGSRWEPLDERAWLSGIRVRAGEQGYLFVRLPGRTPAVAVAADVPSQFLRRWLADSIGVAEWDWRKAGREPGVERTVARMAALLAPAGFQQARC